MKIGIIGYGSIGKRHANNLQTLGVDHMIYDPKITSGYELRTVMERADAFVVASPTSTHFKYLCDLSKARKPIFIEKPIGSKRVERDILLPGGWAMDQDNKQRFFVGYNLRFLRTVQKVKELISDGRIKPTWASFTCAQFNDRPAYQRDGVILNWSHEIDLALHLLGPATLKSSHTVLRDGQDVMTDMVLEHYSGVISTIHLDYLTDPQFRGFNIIGDKHSQIACGIEEGMLVHKRAITTEMMAEGDFDDCYVREMEQFIKFVETGDRGAGCSASEALQVLDICLRVRQQAGLEV